MRSRSVLNVERGVVRVVWSGEGVVGLGWMWPYATGPQRPWRVFSCISYLPCLFRMWQNWLRVTGLDFELFSNFCPAVVFPCHVSINRTGTHVRWILNITLKIIYPSMAIKKQRRTCQTLDNNSKNGPYRLVVLMLQRLVACKTNTRDYHVINSAVSANILGGS